MTGKEAIRILEELASYENILDLIENRSVSLQNACYMAIKSLEQEPCGDKLAIERYQDLVDFFGDKDIAKGILEDREEFKKWLDRMKWHVRKVDELARKLEQEPCEDAVDRKKVWYLITGGKYSDESYEQFIDRLVEELNNLPSVTPTRKVGKWIKHYCNNGNLHHIECSNCHDWHENFLEHKYCPNCGAEMRESEGEE